MVEAPLVLPRALQELDLSRSDLESLGDLLSAENKKYGDLKQGGACTIDTDIQPGVLYTVRTVKAGDEVITLTSFMLHDNPEDNAKWGGPFVSIHFRENLPELFSIVSEFDRWKAFLHALGSDLYCLAQILKEGNLRGVRMIVGLTTLSAKWGENHGFSTHIYSTDHDEIEEHLRSVGLPFQGRWPPLTIFVHQTHTFIEEFLGKSRTIPRVN